MARTRKKTLVKLGGFEISRRVPVVSRPRIALAEKPAPKLPKPTGISGNGPSWSGYTYGSDYLEKLQGARGRMVYDEMRRSDPQVQSILKAITLPIRQADFYVEPISDSEEDKGIAEEIEGDFFRGMTQTWDDTIRHILLMLPFGFSVLEKVWEYRDGRIRPRKLDPRLPQSVVKWQWEKDNRRLIGPVQMNEEGKDILLPIERLLVFTTEKEGDDWEGISLLRPLYKPWYIKNELEKINAIKHDRHGVGTPRVSMPHGFDENSEEYQAAIETVEAFQAQEQSYLVQPEGWAIDILGGGDKAGTDALPSIKYYDEAMARCALTMFTMLGSTETGSRALGESFTDTFLMAEQALADYICEVLNRFAVRQWVDYNLGGSEYPELKVRRIRSLDPQVLAIITSARLLTPDLELENALRAEMNLPERKEEEVEIRTPPPEPDPEEDEEPDDAEDPETPPEDVEASHHHHGLELADRELTEEERLCDLSGIEMRLNTDTSSLLEAIMTLRDAQIRRVIDLIVGGRKVQDIAVPAKKEMYDLLLKEFRRQIRKGRDEVVDELRRQGAKSLALADTVDLDVLLRLIEEKLALKVEGAADKLKAILAELGINLKEAGLSGEELRSGLAAAVAERLADVTWTELASTAVNEGWGAGRDIEQAAHDDEIAEVYRSGILDGKICEVCAPKDQVRHELGDPEYKTPDPNCKGGPGRCRCINIAIMARELAGE